MERQVEGQRGLELRISNAVFSKLIKMGREQGKTPQRVGQALFEEAYEAACLGKGTKDQVAAAGKLADAMEHDLKTQLDDARARLQKTEEERAELWRRNRELGSERNVDNAVLADLRAQLDQAQKTIASKDTMLLDQARQIREANAEIEQLRQRIEEECGAPAWIVSPVLEQAAIDAASMKPGPIEIVAAPAEPAIERLGPIVPVRAIKGMNAAGNSPAAIARDLGLDLAIVRQVLG